MSTKSAPKTRQERDHESSAINAIKQMTGPGGQEPSNQRVAAQVVGVAGVVSLVIGLALIPAGQAVLAVVLVGLAFVLMGVALVVALKAASKTHRQEPSTRTEAEPQRAISHQWSRIIPKQPITDADNQLMPLKTRLDDLRTTVADRIDGLRKGMKAPDIGKTLIRCNIFLSRPDRLQVYCEPIQLFIPPYLHSNMDNDPDRHIEFRSHEGVTGRTFTLGEAYGAKAVPGPESNDPLLWSAVRLFPDKTPVEVNWGEFVLTKKQIEQINIRIRWIISLPIFPEGSDAKKTTMAVLNVDGLDHELSDEEMDSVARALEGRVRQIARELENLPMCRIAIDVEDLPATVT